MLSHVWPVNLVLSPQAQLVSSGLFLVASILFIRKSSGAPAVLLVIGSIGWLVFWLLNAFPSYTYATHATPLDGCVYRHWALCVAEHVGVLATLCFPIGLLWLALRST